MGISTRLSPSYAVRFWVGWLVQLLRGCTSLLVGWYTITWLVHFLLWQAAKAERRQVHPLGKQLHPLRRQVHPLRKQQHPLTNKNAKD